MQKVVFIMLAILSYMSSNLYAANGDFSAINGTFSGNITSAGTVTAGAISANGQIVNNNGGYKFPDGTVQTTAVSPTGIIRRLASSTITGGQSYSVTNYITVGSAAPTISQGLQLFSLSAAAPSASSTFILRGSINAVTPLNTVYSVVTVWKDALLVGTIGGPVWGGYLTNPISFEIELPAEDTNTHTFTVRCGPWGGSGALNINGGTSYNMGNSMKSTFAVDVI